MLVTTGPFCLLRAVDGWGSTVFLSYLLLCVQHPWVLDTKWVHVVAVPDDQSLFHEWSLDFSGALLCNLGMILSIHPHMVVPTQSVQTVELERNLFS